MISRYVTYLLGNVPQVDLVRRLREMIPTYRCQGRIAVGQQEDRFGIYHVAGTPGPSYVPTSGWCFCAATKGAARRKLQEPMAKKLESLEQQLFFSARAAIPGECPSV